MPATSYDLVIEQGKTLQRVIRWETEPYIYKPISAITRTAPVAITTSGNHNVPDGWRVAATGIVGMTELNAERIPPRSADYHRATVISPTQIQFNEVSSADYTTYVSGGYLVYPTPVDFSGYSARMKIKDRVGGTLLETLTSDANEIILDAAAYTITLSISALATEAYTWLRGVYDLEMVSGVAPNEVVTAILTGKVKVVQEVTTA
jgi:hypothetical protein